MDFNFFLQCLTRDENALRIDRLVRFLHPIKANPPKDGDAKLRV
jgi:hypothetical protein